MADIKIYHNPRCSKSRASFSLLQDKGVEFETIEYLKNPPSYEQIKELLKMLGFKSARELMRTKEDIYKELNLKNETDEDKLIKAMSNNPKLIERPIVIKGNKAVIGRPIENVERLLGI